MSDNLPATTDRDPSDAEIAKLAAEAERGYDVARLVPRRRRRPRPANAYIRPGLGDLPLSVQLRTALRLLNDTLLPLVDNFEAQQPQVEQCSVCGRNFGGWPEQVKDDHYWQHTPLQRWLAKIGIR